MSIEELDLALLFRNNKSLELSLQLVEQERSGLKEGISHVQDVIILVHAHNRMFIERCLCLIEDQHCLIVTFSSIASLAKYAQVTKTMLIL